MDIKQSVLAAIGTTLPETSIPIVAIFFGATREEAEVGLGAILGAPFMLSTLVVPMLAVLLLIYAGVGKRGRAFRLNYKDVTVDLTCFALAYTVALACAFVPQPPAAAAVAMAAKPPRTVRRFVVMARFLGSNPSSDTRITTPARRH